MRSNFNNCLDWLRFVVRTIDVWVESDVERMVQCNSKLKDSGSIRKADSNGKRTLIKIIRF